jgi:hypothetical protein
MVLRWPLPKLCPVILTSNQDDCQAKNRKKGDASYKKKPHKNKDLKSYGSAAIDDHAYQKV